MKNQHIQTETFCNISKYLMKEKQKFLINIRENISIDGLMKQQNELTIF